MKHTILLTGASGSVGYQTLKKLLKQRDKYTIKVFELKNRRTCKKLNPHKKKIDIIWGDITNNEDIEKAVRNSDTIIHTAALIPPKADDLPELAGKINVGGTQNIVNAMNKFNPEAFLIYTSSISVYGDRIENPEISILDSLSPSPRDFYAKTKIKAENYIKINTKNFTIFRLSAVMDIRMNLDPLFFHMPLNTPLEIVTAGDVASALVNAVDKKYYLNERIFNLGGGKNCRISYEDFLNKNFKLFGLKKINFPKYAFAEKNFHCGYFKDSKSLDNLLHFQRDTIDDYLEQVAQRVNPFRKKIMNLFRTVILKNLLKRSDPYKAYINRNLEMINHFFINKTHSFN